jgi:hypothetical protein
VSKRLILDHLEKRSCYCQLIIYKWWVQEKNDRKK